MDDSLDICKALFEQSWKSYDNEHYHLLWKDQLTNALTACKGLLNLSVRRLTDDYKAEANMYFILFLVFVDLSSVTVITLLYLISKIRCFISLRKCVLSSIQDREGRGPNTPSGLLPVNTRLTVRSYTP